MAFITNKKSYFVWKKPYKYDIIWAILIVVLPIIIYTHLFFSKESQSFSIWGFEFSHTYDHNQTFMWFLLKNFSIFVLFLMWFFSSSKMWKYIFFLFFFIFFRELYTELTELFSDTRKVDHLVFFGVFILVLSTVTFLDVFLFKPYRSNKMKTSISDFLVNNYKSIYETLSYEVLSMATKHNLKNPQKRLRIAYYLKNRILVVLKRDNTKINLRMNKLFNYIISFVLVLSFLLWFLNRLIPVGTQQLDLGFMVLKTYGFNDINILIWYLASKAMIIIPLFVWFITCSYWWRFAILSPITLYVFQFWEAFQDTNSLEGWGNARAFPIIFCIIIFLLIFSKSVKYKFGVVEMYEYLTDQIETDLEMLVVKDQSLKGKFLEYELLKKQTVTLSNSKTYLNSLLNLKHSLELKLRDKDTDVDR